MTEIGTVIEGKYQILNEIGRGGMSVVYLAMDTRLNKTWAVKEVLKTGKSKNGEIYVNSLLAEANLMKRLDHPAFPRIVDIIDNGESLYIVMDYVEGESLDKVLEEHGAQPEELVIEWSKQLCEALYYLHSQKPPIIYRDMKPANVMLLPNGHTVKIIDFGIAREFKDQNLADTTVLGTKGYAPPEQYERRTDQRSDIYALGKTMHQLLTGIDPRGNEEYHPVREWNPELSDGIEAIIEDCLRTDPADRYQNCAELMYDLEDPSKKTVKFRRTQKRRLTAFIAAAAVCVVTLISGFVCRAVSENLNSSSYDSLLGISRASSMDVRLDSYEQAVGIYPERTDAYFSMLEAYEDEGVFSRADNERFLAVYNRYKDEIDPTTVEAAELNYKIGQMYFNYYTSGDEGVSFSNRVQKAYPFFAANYENAQLPEEFEHRDISNCYYQICSFYKKYVLSSSNVQEASKEDYENLIATIEGALDDVRDAGAYDQLTLYNGTFMLLYDQRASLVSANMDEDEILALLDTVCGRAEALSVNKEQSQKLRQEILDNHETYREAIQRAWSNTRERG